MKRFRVRRPYEKAPESLVTPYEDINTKQQKITGERLPDIILELCDSCRALILEAS
jgi:hypothetical protein